MSLENFSIILPGGCNANCAFCNDKGDITTVSNYMQLLDEAINTLPESYTQVSITGGEPTLSPYLLPVLNKLSLSGKFNKVVLTTNGAALLKKLDKILPHINHINISRHAVTDAKNMLIFGTRTVLKREGWFEVVEKCHAANVDVCCNVVYPRNSTYWHEARVLKLVDYLPADKFAFRLDMHDNNLSPTWLENCFDDYEQLFNSGCPVCRSHGVVVNGKEVIFKASLAEPSVDSEETEPYELVFHEDGTLSEDWSKKMVVPKKPRPKQRKEDREITMSAGELERYVQRRIREAEKEPAHKQTERDRRAGKKVPKEALGIRKAGTPLRFEDSPTSHCGSRGWNSCGTRGGGACGRPAPSNPCGGGGRC